MKSPAVARAVLNVVLPPRCLRCGTLVAEDDTLCAPCWTDTSFLGPPHCACCGLPFAYDEGAGALCSACHAHPPAFSRARAAARYDDRSKNLVLAFKHGDRTHAGRALGAWMARAGAELAADCDLIVPVPLHWTRLFARRYNQAALLAQSVGAAWNKPVDPMVLRRLKRTPSLGHLSPSARRRALAGVFRVAPSRNKDIADRRVVLIDDVLTTGTTAGACARALRRAGAKGVDVLTFPGLSRHIDAVQYQAYIIENIPTDGPRRLMVNIEVYSTAICPYCYRAKNLLKKKGVDYTEIDVTMNPRKRAEMTNRAGGHYTVPQIFIDGDHVGGCDELYDLEFDGELDSKLGLSR